MPEEGLNIPVPAYHIDRLSLFWAYSEGGKKESVQTITSEVYAFTDTIIFMGAKYRLNGDFTFCLCNNRRPRPFLYRNDFETSAYSFIY